MYLPVLVTHVLCDLVSINFTQVPKATIERILFINNNKKLYFLVVVNFVPDDVFSEIRIFRVELIFPST